MTPVRLEPAALRSRVKHSTTEPLHSLLNHLLLERYFIYKTKFVTNFITLATFLSYLRRKYLTEKCISNLHKNHVKFLCKWPHLDLDAQLDRQPNLTIILALDKCVNFVAC